jgi:DNA repair exonuclease SbcCD nuclease subunit
MKLRSNGITKYDGARGHIHARQVHSETPFVVMPGIPQGRDIGEEGPKTVTVIEVSGEELKLSERNVSIAEFARTNVNLAGKENWQSMLESLRAALENARKAAISDHVICRLELVGSSILGWRLHRDADLLLVEAQDAADQIGQIWIDKIENKVTAPTASAEDADPVDELAMLMKEVAEDGAFRAEATSHLEHVIRALPVQLRNRFGTDQSSTEVVLDRLLEQGATDVVASLKSGQIEREGP